MCHRHRYCICTAFSEVAHGIHYIQYFDLQIIFIRCFHMFTQLVYSTGRMSQVTGQQVNSFILKYIYIYFTEEHDKHESAKMLPNY